MTATTWRTSASREQVWQVLSDGWLYASWVVGASRIRDVESGWPAAGSKIHHSVGAWPLLLDDETQVITAEPSRLLVLQARTRPFGEASVRIVLEDVDVEVGAPADTLEIRMHEDLISGAGRAVPSAVRQRLLVPRNRESLRRLALLAEGRA
ncbi:SRPBCC family protein [Jatrophihabitans sp. DSM 45814]